MKEEIENIKIMVGSKKKFYISFVLIYSDLTFAIYPLLLE
jgi:hypothetical protein